MRAQEQLRSQLEWFSSEEAWEEVKKILFRFGERPTDEDIKAELVRLLREELKVA